ncbi:saccharopine dehydrogenase family protein [Thermoproteus tenax]|uniref:Saccharopine dehydrogenase family protein n=1 Tax=Thermoproteus tenax (strain ATCC 35583 / DSM 2078 / JCM 9277 / NBRC 100435 / Kra 1) TaxID=768679 RepID=G4RPG8_THETK|nr:saccharopine dehydrogenase C-terminal domain-containing protein [Thermoproteus tenax]CCC81463.1 saccharopine dehydrogenase family protein [Thermoproteus tenax Kra 1]
MKTLIVGCGNIGKFISATLAEKGHEVVTVDVRGGDCPGIIKGDVGSVPLGSIDLAISALPGSVAYNVASYLLERGLDVIDVSYMPEDPLALGKVAERTGARYVPDAGVAPGLSNMLVGRMISEVKQLSSVKIYVGGVPKVPVGPLGYSITWSPHDLIEEYTRPARVVRNGRIESVDPLSDVETVKTPLGEMEAFYTDGLRTLLATIKVSNIFEKTLRWPGHLEKIKLLRDLGLMSDEPIEGVRPKQILAALLGRLKYDVPDVVYMRITGEAEGERVTFETLVEPSGGWSAMQRATGLTAISLVSVIKDLPPGVTPPEVIGMSNKLMPRILAFLKQNGINISVEKLTRSVL